MGSAFLGEWIFIMTLDFKFSLALILVFFRRFRAHVSLDSNQSAVYPSSVLCLFSSYMYFIDLLSASFWFLISTLVDQLLCLTKRLRWCLHWKALVKNLTLLSGKDILNNIFKIWYIVDYFLMWNYNTNKNNM